MHFTMDASGLISVGTRHREKVAVLLVLCWRSVFHLAQKYKLYVWLIYTEVTSI